MDSLHAQQRTNKAFTHPHYTVLEKRLLRYMLSRLCQLLENRQAKPIMVSSSELVEPDGRYHRIMLIRPECFNNRQSYAIVGFFGQRNFDADDQDIAERDELLYQEMDKHEGLLSYSTLELTNGDYGNCVVFSDEHSKNQWGRSAVHEIAVRELSPRFYHSVRLYNGQLQASIRESHRLKLTTVKYFDYQSEPPWMAHRDLLKEY